MAPTASAYPDASPPRPKYWEKLILYSYLWLMGATQKDAGRAVGRAVRTVQEWEEDKGTLTAAQEAARQRWLGELTNAARQTLLATIRGGSGELALKVLERTDRDLATPTQRMQHQVEVGEGLSSLLKAFGGPDAGPR